MKYIIQLVLIALLFNISVSYSQGRFLINENELYGYMDINGNEIIKPVYRSAGHFSEGLAAVRKNGTYGFINTEGDVIIPSKYDMALPFIGGVAKVYLDGKPLFIDTNGKVLFEHDFESIERFNEEGFARATLHSQKMGLINLNGELVLDTIYKSIGAFENGVAIVKGQDFKSYPEEGSASEIGVINSKGKMIVPFYTYDNISDFENGYAKVELNTPSQRGYYTHEGIIDTTGKLLFKVPATKWKFDFLSDGSDAYFEEKRTVMVYHEDPNKVDNPYDEENVSRGVVNTNGRLLFSNSKWEDITPFRNDRAFAKTVDNNWFLIDSSGNILNETPYSDVEFSSNQHMVESIFKNGIHFVQIDNDWFGIDREGHLLTSPLNFCPLSYSGFIDHGLYKIISYSYSESDKRYEGLWNFKTGNKINPEFDYIHFTGSDSIFLVQKDGQFGYVNQHGSPIWMESKNHNDKLLPLNIDHMKRGYFYASSPYNEKYAGLGGWGRSKNKFDTISNNSQFLEDSLQIYINVSADSTFHNQHQGISLFVANTTEKTYLFNAQDSRLYMVLQAKDKHGVWRDIEYTPSSWCGNSYHTLYLPSGNKWSFTIPKYEGGMKTKLRASLRYRKENNEEEYVLYSNTISGSVNPAQFWRKPGYVSSGLMDPYND